MKKILDDVLKDIKPSKQEEKETLAKIDSIIKIIQKSIPKAKVILGGSGKKGTWLRNAHDADIFVQYEKGTKNISDKLETKLKKNFKIRRLHGSRDYFQIKKGEFTYEIIPIIEIKKADHADNITDISPLHAKYVLKHKKYQDEIRLTKQFFKGLKIYGAESYINGFSGYICEILTIHYQGFKKMIKEISKWRQKTLIDPQKYHKNILFDLDKSKTLGPLVIVDPVQESRNAAAAVSEEKFEKLIKLAKAFVKKPSEKFFEIKNINVEKIKKKYDKFFVFEVEALGGKEDIVGCKLVKIFTHIKRELNRHEFKILYGDWEWLDKAYFYYAIKDEKKSKKITLKGPPVSIKKHALIFKKKHKKVFEKNKILYTEIERKFLTPEELMKTFLKDKYIKERIKTIKIK